MTGPVPVVRRRVAGAHDRWHTAPIRTRLTAAAGLAATLTIVAVVAVAYVAVRHELRGNIDSQLRHQASEIHLVQAGELGQYPVVQARVGDVGGLAQLVSPNGDVQTAQDQTLQVPVTAADKNVAAHGGHAFHDAVARGIHFRVLTTQVRGVDGHAVSLALPLTAMDSQLHKLRWAFLVLGLLGFGLVVVGTWLVVRRMMRPVAELTEAAEEVAVTRDLTTRISTYSKDELGRLADSFNTMLDALERSLGQQRQLILDASHELRTPLSSLRTNVEVLHDVDRLAPDQRRALLDGVVTQLDELTVLVADVVELARGDVPDWGQEDMSLDELVSRAVDRARRHWPHIVFMLQSEPVMVRGVPARLDRAVANLLDNAGKFSPPGAVVDVTVEADGTVTVADRGPGVPTEALPLVFDRFFRADEARALPGSGLGLAIVKQVVDGHGGTVALANRPDGGAEVRLSLPPLPREEQVPMIDATPAPQTVGG